MWPGSSFESACFWMRKRSARSAAVVPSSTARRCATTRRAAIASRRSSSAGARGERGGQHGHLAVEVGGGPVLAQVLERLGARVAGHVAQPPGIALLPVLEAVEGELVEVVAGGVLRGREAVGIVLQMPGQVGEHLEQVLVGRE